MTLPRRTVLKDSAIALPRPALLSDSAVARSVWSSAGSAAATTYLAPPTAGAELVITVRGGVPNMFVIGPRTTATWKSTRDLSATATLKLRPGVLRALFGVSAVDLRDAAVPAHELLGRALVDRALDLTTRSTTHAALGVVTLARWKLEVTHGACALHADPTYGTGGKLDIPILHNWNYDSNIAQGYCTLPRVHHYPTGNQCESTWRLSASPDGAVYMVDTILGIYRIDRGTVEPTCPTNGWTRLVFDAKGRAVADLAEELDLATCKVTKLPWALTEQKNGPMTLLAGFIGTEPIIDRDAMFHGTTQYGHRYGEGDSDRICQTAMAFPCGDDVCFADSGCMKVSRFTFDGRFRGAWTLSGRDTSPVPERMLSSARTPAGDLLMLTVHRYWREGTQRPDDKFEVWPTLMPAAAFTP